jgi:transcriptional regulator with XRE-family HTH domain
MRLNLTQEDVAQGAGVTTKFLSEIENGHKSPTIGALASIVEKGLGMSLSAFFAVDDPLDLRDDLDSLRALLGTQPAAMRRRVLRLVRALLEEG